MALSVFEDKTHRPTPSDLKDALGKRAGLWDRLIAHSGQHYPPITRLWHFAGAKYGWSLRLKRRERIILYMTPQQGQFLVGVVLGDKALQVAKRQDLPPVVLTLIASAPRYPEGTGIRLPIITTADLRAVERLAAAKMAS